MVVLLLATAAGADPRYSGAAMPLTSYSSDTGIGFGARAFAQRLGDGEDRPIKLEAQAFGTSYGQQFHFVSLDVPHAFGTRMRLELLGGYRREVAAPYYGIGNDTLPSESVAGSQYAYREEAPMVRLRMRWPIAGALSVLAGYRFIDQHVSAPPGSLLAQQAPFGSQGGRYGELSAGLAFDTRDDELAPTRGVLLELTGRATHPAFGSEAASAGLFAAVSVYTEIAPRLVLAGRFAFDATAGQVPFDRLQDFGSLTTPFYLVSGVGGALTVRGLLQSEYVGPMKAIGNLELRYKAIDTMLLGHRVGLAGVAFIDEGRVFVPGQPIAAGGVHTGVGSGLRFFFGESVLLRTDAAFAEGRTRIYADFGYNF